MLSASCTQSFDDYKVGVGGTGGTTIGGGGSGANGGGGAGGGVACTTANAATACNDNNVCTVDTCNAGKCVNTNQPDGLVPGYTDNPTDCIEDRCVGGQPMDDAPDDTEVPDDNNECTNQSCSGGTVQTQNVNNGTPCGNGLSCNDGVCDGCTNANQCGTDTVCATFVCTPQGECVTNFVAVGTEVNIVTGDCRRNECTGNSPDPVQANDDTDVLNDNNVCTTDICVGGAPMNVNNTNNCGMGPNCTGFQQFPQDVCSAGSCTDPAGVACPGGNTCNTAMTACRGMCSGDPQCQTGYVCNATMCCLPQSTAMTCMAVECGSVQNNCNRTVNCPSTCGTNPDGTACITGNQCGCVNNGDCGSSSRGNKCIASTRCGCNMDGDCPANQWCDGAPNNVCTNDLPLGADCLRGAQCLSGNCTGTPLKCT
jgi:hypothetical protein